MSPPPSAQLPPPPQPSSSSSSAASLASLDRRIRQIRRRWFRDSSSSGPRGVVRPADAAAAAVGRCLCAELAAALAAAATAATLRAPAAASAGGAAPSDAAATAAATAIAAVADRVLPVVSDGQVHPSIPQAFFDALRTELLVAATTITTTTTTRTVAATPPRRTQDDSSSITFAFLSQWVVHMERTASAGNHNNACALSACIRAYAVYVATTTATAAAATAASNAGAKTGKQETAAAAAAVPFQFLLHNRTTLDLYRRIALPGTRLHLARETIQAVLLPLPRPKAKAATMTAGSSHYDPPGHLADATRLLSPVVAAALLGNCRHVVVAVVGTGVWQSLQRHAWSRWPGGCTAAERRHWLRWTACLIDLVLLASSAAVASSGAAAGVVPQRETTAAVAAPSLSSSLSSSLSLSYLVEQMWLDWVEWAVLSHTADDAAADSQQRSRMLQTYLPRLLYSSSSSSSAVVVDAVTDLCFQQQQQTDDRSTTLLPALSALACLRLAAFGVATVNSQDRLAVAGLLHVMCCSGGGGGSNSNHSHGTKSLQRCMLLTVASILPHVDPGCHEAAEALRHGLPARKGTKKDAPFNLVELFGLEEPDAAVAAASDSVGNALVYTLVATIRSFSGTNFSARQQTAALLFGVALLDDDGESNSAAATDPGRFRFLQNLLVTYPHLAVQLLSVVTERIDQASQARDGAALMRYLEFACESLAANSHCAHELWNLVGVQWMAQPQHQQQSESLTLRIALVRLFPKLVAGNKRLYRRVVEGIGVCLSGHEVGMRLAAAATLADLAADDNIRDVTDVIGWIQTLLTVDGTDSPIHALLVHYALMSLHSLVVAEVLDFDVVIKVLKKKLCSVTDHAAILKQPMVVIEALVLLLGDGECGGDLDDSDDDDDDEGGRRRPGEKVLSPQVTSAVRALLHIGQAVRELPRKDASAEDAVIRIRRNVFESLSKYSFQALGVDEDGVKLAVSSALGDEMSVLKESDNRFEVLRDLVVTEMGELPAGDQKQEKCALMELAARLVEYEEETLGSTLWQKRGRSQKRSGTIEASKQGLTPEDDDESPFDLRSILPQLSKVQEMADHGPSPATSIALLLSSDGSQLSLLRDHADSSLELLDPLFMMFCVQGYLHTASRLLSVQPQSVGSMLSEMSSWYQIFVSPDAMYLALSCFSIFIPHELQDVDSDKPYVEEIYDTVVAAFKNNDFERGDVAKICVGLLGVSSLRYAKLERLNDIVGQLEQTVRGYGGEQTFGAYYGLALIAQACPRYLRDDVLCQIPTAEIKNLVSRINGFVLEDLVACFGNGGDAITKLVSSTKRGKVTANLIEAVLNLGPNAMPLLMTKKVVARYLFLSCAVCFPALASVNSYLLLAIFRFLESLEWGSGKGVALPSVMKACQGSGVMKDELLEQVYLDYVAAFKERFDRDESDADPDGLEDLFLALKGVRWTVSPDAVYELPVANRDFFRGNDGGVLALAASVMSIASLSCFGTTHLEALSHLDENVADDDINAVVDLMFEAVTVKDDSKRGDMGTILMGLLSAISDPEIRDDDDDDDSLLSPDKTDLSGTLAKGGTLLPPDDVTSLAAASATDESVIQLAFEKLPSPQLGTVVAGVRDLIERVCATAIANSQHEAILSRALRSLQLLSIPDKYAKAFLEPLVRENIARDAGITVLCSQISIRRRAYSDGRSFVTFATQICMAPTEEWSRLLGHGSIPLSFVGKLAEFGPKLPADSVSDCINNIWDKCLTSADPTRTEMICSFLPSVSHLLASTAISPKVMQVLREFTHGRLFEDICGMQLSTTTVGSGVPSNAIFHHYVRCLKVVPHSNLDDIRFFRLSPDSPGGFRVESFRAIVVSELVKLSYFNFEQREVKELSNVASWFSKSILAWSEDGQRDAFRRIACSFSSAMIHELSAAKRDRLTAVLDLLLLTDMKTGRMALEWLAVVAAYWCAGQDSNGDLSLGYLCSIEPAAVQALPPSELDQFFQIALSDLPCNLAAIARREKMSTTVSNQLHRLFRLWSDVVGMGKDATDRVQRAIMCCHSNATSEDAFLNLATSILSEVP